MKKTLIIASIGLLMLVGCTTVKTASTGLPNEAYLEIIGTPSQYIGGVDVQIDDALSFNAKVYNDKVTRTKGKVYAIPTGKHTITVSHNNNVLVKQQIFVSAQETKKIILP